MQQLYAIATYRLPLLPVVCRILVREGSLLKHTSYSTVLLLVWSFTKDNTVIIVLCVKSLGKFAK